ncbi:UDP-N-acetylmuramate dehydrogenase [Candidatus Jidaibacter acanthamoebae]|nr:UDP-N-acetylmuramate dehydrogenase [Candidatus Jidaibacter acanthamoeba]
MTIISELPIVKGKYREQAELAKMCWFGVGGKAEVLFIPEDLQDLELFLKNKPLGLAINIIGVGSNLLVRDGGIGGVVIRLGRGFNYIEHNTDCIITAGAAVLDLNLALYTREAAITGLEFFSGIPGTVGGALAMNAGAYGNDTASVLIEATAVNLKSGEIKTFKAEEIGYYYRGKHLSNDWIFTEAKFQGNPGEVQRIAGKIDEIQSQRSSTQPIKTKTSGSTFKNPMLGDKAWQLVDKAGCRGLRIGGAQVSEMHCNFFINMGDATAHDLESLIKEVQSRVLTICGIKLEEEIKIIGEA